MVEPLHQQKSGGDMLGVQALIEMSQALIEISQSNRDQPYAAKLHFTACRAMLRSRLGDAT